MSFSSQRYNLIAKLCSIYYLYLIVQTLLFLSFLTVSITIIIVALMLSVARSSCDNSHPEDMELLTDDEDFSPRTTSKFNLTLPRKVSSFCLNFRQILEQENYFALNTWKVCVRNLPFIHASKKSFDIPRNKTKLIVFNAQMFSLFSEREMFCWNVGCWMLVIMICWQWKRSLWFIVYSMDLGRWWVFLWRGFGECLDLLVCCTSEC